MPDTIFLDGPHGEIEATRIVNDKLGIETWGFECPGCHLWGLVYPNEWELDGQDRLTVSRPLSCRSSRCELTFHVKRGNLEVV